MSGLTLAIMAEQYANLKAQEADLAERRRAIAAQIAAATGHTGEGSKTYSDGDWKVTVKCPQNRTMDWDIWDAVKAAIPADLWPVEYKRAIDEKGVKWIQANDPQTYGILAQALTTKPGAVQVTVTPINQE
jgi:hypothetical protein